MDLVNYIINFGKVYNYSSIHSYMSLLTAVIFI